MLSDPNRIRTLLAEAGFVDVTVDAPAKPIYSDQIPTTPPASSPAGRRPLTNH
jgi:hypothetical protein